MSVSAEGILTLSPAASWGSSTTGSSTDIHEDPDGVVIFMSGVYFKKRPLVSSMSAPRRRQEDQMPVLRADDGRPDSLAVETGDEEDILDIEYYGKLDEDPAERRKKIPVFFQNLKSKIGAPKEPSAGA